MPRIPWGLVGAFVILAAVESAQARREPGSTNPLADIWADAYARARSEDVRTSAVLCLGDSQIKAAGFKKLVLYNTHGGNTSLIDVMARDLRAEFGLRTFALHGSGGVAFEGLSPQERAYGFHAGEVETAFLLASVPDLVDCSAYTVNYIADISEPALLRPENAPAVFAWLTRDIASSGVLGDPRPATAENGAAWISEAATRLASALETMFRYPAQAAVEPAPPPTK